MIKCQIECKEVERCSGIPEGIVADEKRDRTRSSRSGAEDPTAENSSNVYKGCSSAGVTHPVAAPAASHVL